MSGRESLEELLAGQGAVRSKDLAALGISRSHLTQMLRSGKIVRVARGLYVSTDASAVTEHHSLVEASKLVPSGVICLLSALRFHELSTQNPAQVWLATGSRWQPTVPGTSVRILRFSGQALSAGIERHVIEGVQVRIYNPAKTVADCFKFRNKIGLDVALEALRDCWRQRKATMDELWEYAKVCRVANVMRPYLESLV